MIINSEVISRLPTLPQEGDVFTGSALRANNIDRDIYAYKIPQDGSLYVLIKSERSFGTPMVREGVTVRRLQQIVNEAKSYYLTFCCTKPEYLSNFTEIINEIDDKCEKSKDVEVVSRRVLETWFSFLNLPRKNLLTNVELYGLIGELEFLKSLCLHFDDHKTILNSWRGPFGNKNDFVFSNVNVEIKTTTKHPGYNYRIHGLEQLDSFQKPIYLQTYYIRVVEGGENKFKILLEEIESILEENRDVLNKFYDALYSMGFDIRDRKEYNLSYIIEFRNHYDINDEFPCLTRKTVRSLDRIFEVEYGINLLGYPVSYTSLLDEILL